MVPPPTLVNKQEVLLSWKERRKKLQLNISIAIFIQCSELQTNSQFNVDNLVFFIALKSLDYLLFRGDEQWIAQYLTACGEDERIPCDPLPSRFFCVFVISCKLHCGGHPLPASRTDMKQCFFNGEDGGGAMRSWHPWWDVALAKCPARLYQKLPLVSRIRFLPFLMCHGYLDTGCFYTNRRRAYNQEVAGLNPQTSTKHLGRKGETPSSSFTIICPTVDPKPSLLPVPWVICLHRGLTENNKNKTQ